MQKTYFIIASTQYGPIKKDVNNGVLELQLPPEFLNSRNKKHIEVRNVKLLYKDVVVADAKFHSTIIYENPWDDHFICFANEQLVKPKKYEWKASKPTIKIWFSDMKNKILDADDYTIETLIIF
jgi:hypothetical protein